MLRGCLVVWLVMGAAGHAARLHVAHDVAYSCCFDAKIRLQQMQAACVAALPNGRPLMLLVGPAAAPDLECRQQPPAPVVPEISRMAHPRICQCGGGSEPPQRASGTESAITQTGSSPSHHGATASQNEPVDDISQDMAVVCVQSVSVIITL